MHVGDILGQKLTAKAVHQFIEHLQYIVAFANLLLLLNLLISELHASGGEGELLLTDRPGLNEGLHNSLTEGQ